MKPGAGARDVDGKASQASSLAGPWQWLRGYWLAPVNITGCCMSVWPVVRCALLVSTPLRLAPSRPCGCTQPPLCLAPLRPCTRHQLAARAAPNTEARAGHGFAIAARDHSQALARGDGGWPRPSAIRPRGAPQRLASPITSTKGEDHHARAKHHSTGHGHHAGSAARVRAPVRDRRHRPGLDAARLHRRRVRHHRLGACAAS